MNRPMKLIGESSGVMECQVCGLSHVASIQSGLERADGITRYYWGNHQCSNAALKSNRSASEY